MKNFHGLYHFTPDSLTGRGHCAHWRHGKDRWFLYMFLHMKERQVHSTRGVQGCPCPGAAMWCGKLHIVPPESPGPLFFCPSDMQGPHLNSGLLMQSPSQTRMAFLIGQPG